MQFELHSFLAVLSIAFIAVHGFALLFDGFFHFTPLSVIVPFASPYRPLWTGLGVIAAWLTALIAASTYTRKHIGYRNWRRLHYGTFACYALSLLHGITSGTDTGSSLVIAIYFLSAASVLLALTFRIERTRVAQRNRCASRRHSGQPARPQSEQRGWTATRQTRL
jgi:predicted ferric reductase